MSGLSNLLRILGKTPHKKYATNGVNVKFYKSVIQSSKRNSKESFLSGQLSCLWATLPKQKSFPNSIQVVCFQNILYNIPLCILSIHSQHIIYFLFCLILPKTKVRIPHQNLVMEVTLAGRQLLLFIISQKSQVREMTALISQLDGRPCHHQLSVRTASKSSGTYLAFNQRNA